MKGKITAIMLLACIVFTIGTCVAYYNTKSFGFDDDVRLIYGDDEKISIMDFDIYYEDVNEFIENVKEFIPDKSHRIV